GRRAFRALRDGPCGAECRRRPGRRACDLRPRKGKAADRAGQMRAAKQPPELRPTNRRIESFSDAVFAIAVTIMVLEIRVPDRLAFADDAVDFQEFATLLAIYVLSFVVVGILWANHHYLVFTLPKSDRVTI